MTRTRDNHLTSPTTPHKVPISHPSLPRKRHMRTSPSPPPVVPTTTTTRTSISKQPHSSKQQEEDLRSGILLDIAHDAADYIPLPLDGGWGWVVVFASMMCMVILDGINYSFGIFLGPFAEYFQESKTKVSLVGSMLVGMYNINGPVVSALINRFGCRRVTIAGSVVASLAFLLSTRAPSVDVLIVTYGVMGGFGLGMIYLPSIVSVGYYFEKKRALATGIAVCGSGIGTFIFAPLSQYLLQELDWKNALMLISGITLNAAVCGMLMRPLKPSSQTSQPRAQTQMGGLKEQTNGNKSHTKNENTTSYPLDDTSATCPDDLELQLLSLNSQSSTGDDLDTKVTAGHDPKLKSLPLTNQSVVSNGVVEGPFKINPKLVSRGESSITTSVSNIVPEISGDSFGDDVMGIYSTSEDTSGSVLRYSPFQNNLRPTSGSVTPESMRTRGSESSVVLKSCLKEKGKILTTNSELDKFSSTKDRTANSLLDKSCVENVSAGTCVLGSDVLSKNSSTTPSALSKACVDEKQTPGLSTVVRMSRSRKDCAVSSTSSVRHRALTSLYSTLFQRGKAKNTILNPSTSQGGNAETSKTGSCIPNTTSSQKYEMDCPVRGGKDSVGLSSKISAQDYVRSLRESRNQPRDELMSLLRLTRDSAVDARKTEERKSRAEEWDCLSVMTSLSEPTPTRTPTPTPLQRINSDSLTVCPSSSGLHSAQNHRILRRSDSDVTKLIKRCHRSVQKTSVPSNIQYHVQMNDEVCVWEIPDYREDSTSENLRDDDDDERNRWRLKAAAQRRTRVAEPGLIAGVGVGVGHSLASLGVSKKDLARPLYRKDIFYSGSITQLPLFRSQPDMKSYITSITTIPGEPALVGKGEGKVWRYLRLPRSAKDTLQEMLDLSLLRDRAFLLVCLGNVLVFLGFYVPFVFSVDLAVSLGVSKSKAAFIISVIGITNTVGRVVTGWLADLRNINSLVITYVSIFVCGLSTALFPFCTSYGLLCAAASLFGLSVAGFISVSSILICDLLGLEKLTNGFGLMSVFRGVAAMAGPPLAGFVYEQTRSYKAAFILGGSLLAAGSLSHLALSFPCFAARCAVRETEIPPTPTRTTTQSTLIGEETGIPGKTPSGSSSSTSTTILLEEKTEIPAMNVKTKSTSTLLASAEVALVLPAPCRDVTTGTGTGSSTIRPDTVAFEEVV